MVVIKHAIIMKSLIFTLLAFFSLSAHSMVAQSIHHQDICDSTINNESYAFRPEVNRNYDYAAMVKKQRMLTLADDVMNLGFLLTIATAVGGAFLLDLDELESDTRQLWVYIPCATAVMVGEMMGTIYLSQYIKRKAENIHVASILEYDLNDTYAIAVCNHHNRISGTDSPGIGIKISF